MKIKLVQPAVVDCVTHPKGATLEVPDDLAARFIAQGKAEQVVAKARAKKAPTNRMVEPEDIDTRGE